VTIVANRAAVRPRVTRLHAPGESAVLLEDLVARWLESRVAGVVALHGEPGSGKSAALAHIAALFDGERRLLLLDETDRTPDDEIDPAALVIHVTEQTPERPPLARLRLARWSADEWIEYLLHAHRERCASVMTRLQVARDGEKLDGPAELCSVVLDELAHDDSLSGVQSALDRHTAAAFGDVATRSQVASACLRVSFATSVLEAAELTRVLAQLCGDDFRFIRHRPVRHTLAAQAFASQLAEGAFKAEKLRALPRELERRAAPLVRAQPRAMKRLHHWLAKDEDNAAAGVASLWHLADAGDLAAWLGARKRERKPFVLDGARLRHAPWKGLNAKRFRLENADLSGADLQGADLGDAWLRRANLAGADLSRANLEDVHAESTLFSKAVLLECVANDAEFIGANFQDADLTRAHMHAANFHNADLRRARFHEADLTRARFEGASLDGADFTGARLERAVLEQVDLRGCVFAATSFVKARLEASNLEALDLDGLDFTSVRLQRAHLTGATLRGANLERANLEGAHLAEIDAEGANLRDANLSRVSFHMGSSRGGLVFNAMPMEGSRTGFYTDDYFDNSYKRPEEVRKANLRAADLRGANIEGTDFYLVDLRDALYTPEQLAQFRRCGAILKRR
jgi:uncharacterized protein YjbI with pentapeptide repeats